MDNMQAYNPYLPNWEYIPDGEPYVYDGRLYVFGSHDRFNGKNFCQNDYVLWSAPVDELWNWKKEGIIYQARQDPCRKKDGFMLAPDVVKGADGRFYLYYTLLMDPSMSIAVSDSLTGPYEYYGRVKAQDSRVIGKKWGDIYQFDPGIFRDENGRYYLYSGFGAEFKGLLKMVADLRFQMKGAYVMELEPDMMTVKGSPKLIVPKKAGAAGSTFEGHAFYEASSMRKINGRYYFIYSSELSHELCYAVSDYPDKGFTYGGTLISNGDIGYQGRTDKQALNYTGNTHGSLVKINDQWYVFYHRQTNEHMFSRQGCAEKITVSEDGSIAQVEMTSCGLNSGPLRGSGTYEACIACNLMSKNGTLMYGTKKSKATEKHPYFTQTGDDREENGDQYIANIWDGTVAGFKYFSLRDLSMVGVEISGDGKGVMQVYTSMDGAPVTEIKIDGKPERQWFYSETQQISGIYPLYFRFCGNGLIHFHRFSLR